jgi:hypothetical protein
MQNLRLFGVIECLAAGGRSHLGQSVLFCDLLIQLVQSYRQGYFAEDANSAAKDADLYRGARAAAMQHGSPPSRQILFSATVVPAGVKTKMNHYQTEGSS